MKREQIHIAGMTCAACAVRIEKALRKERGIHSVHVSLALSRAAIQYEPKEIGIRAIAVKIAQLGYRAVGKLSHPLAGIDAEARAYRARFVLAALVSFPLLWAMLAHASAEMARRMPDLFAEPAFQWLLASVLQFGLGYRFYCGAYRAFVHRSANMDTLIAVSTSVAYFYSHYEMFQFRRVPDHSALYFDAIAMIMTAVLLGKWLEAMAKGNALKQLSAMYSLQEKLVRVIRNSGEEWLPAGQVQAGECVVVRSGEWISVDGIVRLGEADTDESTLTGESLAVTKHVGDRVYAGTRCLVGSLQIAVDRACGDTRLSQIIALVETAQQGKPAVQQAVDRIAAMVVPAMLGCAAMTYAGWLIFARSPDVLEMAMNHSLSVLLVACPCALGLATPISILIATGSSARRGILFKEGRSLEKLRQTDVVLLDKTGTLTEGLPQLEAICPAEGLGDGLLRMSAALASLSAHPLAKVVAGVARDKRLSVPEARGFKEWPGKGMEGWVDGRLVYVGSRKWLEESGARLPGEDRHAYSRASGLGHIKFYVVADGEYVGMFRMSDKLGRESRNVVQVLKRKAEVWMVTGDEEGPALAAASAAGIERIRSSMLPEQKLAFIRELQDQGHSVAMVGDGINDAAALAAADVGIVMGGGADAARQAGDVVLVGNKLSRLLEAYAWSRAAMRNIRQNLLFALLYNVLALPLAAFGFLNPRIACIGMAASSVLVVGNSLRLQLEERRQSGARME